MDKLLFPRTDVAGISMPRMIGGTNWIAGWSHRSPAQDQMIRDAHSTTKSVTPIIEAFARNGVDAMMCPFQSSPVLVDAIRETEQKLGQKIIMIDTPIINVENSTEGRKEAEATIAKSQEIGATFCLIHHVSAEQLVRKDKHQIERIDDYTKMIRDHGMIPGLSAHMPELVVYSDENEYDIETYIQIYNCMGFLMQVEVESVHRIIHQAKKPVMTIKSMAAGRVTPFVGLNFNWATIRDCDMVTVGCFTPQEVEEDMEISRAFFEHRPPRVGKRASPSHNQTAFGK